MAISGYCEEKNLHSIFGYKVKPVSVAIKGNLNRFTQNAQPLITTSFTLDLLKKKNTKSKIDF